MKQQAPAKQFIYNGIHVEVYPDKDTLGQAAAEFVTKTIQDAIANKGYARVTFATGASQYEFLAALVKMKGVDWSKVTAFHLDEYLGMNDQHPASFRRYLRERLFSLLPFAQVNLLNGDSPDGQAEARRYSALLAQGDIDLACIGIGENGHLAFNDPPADFNSPNLVNIVDLDAVCRQQQVGEGHFPNLDAVPKQALSQSIPAILRSKVISCVVPDERKAKAVRCSLEGPLTPQCPGSALRLHSNVRLYLDTPATSLLSAKTMGG